MREPRSEEYRERAEQCREHARKAYSDHQKAEGLKTADSWQALAESLDIATRAPAGGCAERLGCCAAAEQV